MKILEIALKDLTRSFRSLFAVGMTIVAPLLLIGLISLAFGGALQRNLRFTSDISWDLQCGHTNRYFHSRRPTGNQYSQHVF